MRLPYSTGDPVSGRSAGLVRLKRLLPMISESVLTAFALAGAV